MVFGNAKIFKKKFDVLNSGFIRTKDGYIDEVDSMENFVHCENEEFVDCSGLEIVPGFVDCHCHIGMWENGLNFEGADGNEETEPICSHLRAIDGINPFDDAFVDAFKAGITTVVTGPGSANPIGGSFAALKTVGNCVDEMAIKPSVGIKFALGENPKNVYDEKGQFPTTRMAVAALIRETLEKARRYLIKCEEAKRDLSVDEPDYDIKLESLKPLLRREVKAFFHCHRTDDIFTAIRIAKEFDLDLVLVHATEGHLIGQSLKDVKIISGPLICDRLKPELKNHSVDGVFELFNKVADLCICTDHPVVPVNFFLQSCAGLKKRGLSSYDVLSLITQKPAEICGIFDKVGSIEKFKCANFVAFKQGDDFFSSYTEPKFVVIDGKIVFEN